MLYKQWDIIIHNYLCIQAIAIVLYDEVEWNRIPTEIIKANPDRWRYNAENLYIFKPNREYNIPKESVIKKIWFMNIENKFSKESLAHEDIDIYPEEDWYETEEED